MLSVSPLQLHTTNVNGAMADTAAAASHPELIMTERGGSLESLELNGPAEAAQEVGAPKHSVVVDLVPLSLLACSSPP